MIPRKVHGRSTFAKFRFAIVCDNPDAPSQKIIGPMSDEMKVFSLETFNVFANPEMAGYLPFGAKIDTDNNSYK